MDFPFVILIVSVVVLGFSADASQYNVSYSDLTTCREHKLFGGYSYSDFFHLNTLNNSKSKSNEVLHLKFYVMTSMDAHILLSEKTKVKHDDRVYEIVLGAGSNYFSAIRTKLSRDRVTYKLSPGLLSAFDPTPVEIIQTRDGMLLVNIPSFEVPFMKFNDSNPLNVSYISFSSYGHTKAKWFYDCPFEEFAEEMEEETKPLSNEERLIADVLSVSDSQFPPPTPSATEVLFSFKVRSVEFDQHSSVLHSRFDMKLNWTDTRLAWKPEEYGGVKSLLQPMFKIWHPELNIAEGALDTFEKFDPFYSVRVQNTGYVQMSARNAELHTWCFAASKNWPHDTTKCNISLSLKDSNVRLVYDTKASLASKSINELSEWKIIKVAVFFTANGNRSRGDETNSGTALYLQMIEDGLNIQLTIHRNSEFYQCAFWAPALVAEGLLLLAFFLEEMRRGGLNLVAFVVLCIGFMILILHAPKGVVSNIVILYDTLLKISIVTYFLHIGTIWLETYPPKLKPHRFIMSVVNWSPLRYVLGMRQKDSSDYLAALEYPWREISKIINRIIFVVLLITFAVISS